MPRRPTDCRWIGIAMASAGRQQQGHAHRPQEGNAAQHGAGWIPAGFGEHGFLGLGVQLPHHTELGPEHLGSQLPAGFRELGAPVVPISGMIDGLTRTPDCPGAGQGLEPEHDTGGVLDQILVGVGQFVEPAQWALP